MICTIIKTLAENDETMQRLDLLLPVRWVYGHRTRGGGGGIVLLGQHGNLQLFVKIISARSQKKRLARISAWGLSYQV